jgi:hypothetical protein
MNKEVINKFILPALAFVAMGIVSTFLFGKLDKISDTQIDIQVTQSANSVEIEYIKELVEGLSETQGTVQGASGDNAFEIAFIKRDITDLKEKIKELED